MASFGAENDEAFVKAAGRMGCCARWQRRILIVGNMFMFCMAVVMIGVPAYMLYGKGKGCDRCDAQISGIPGLEMLGNEGKAFVLLFLAVGALLLFISFLGCCGSIKHSRCMLIIYSTLLVLMLGLELASAGYAFSVFVMNGGKKLREIFCRNWNRPALAAFRKDYMKMSGCRCCADDQPVRAKDTPYGFCPSGGTGDLICETNDSGAAGCERPEKDPLLPGAGYEPEGDLVIATVDEESGLVTDATVVEEDEIVTLDHHDITTHFCYLTPEYPTKSLYSAALDGSRTRADACKSACESYDLNTDFPKMCNMDGDGALGSICEFDYSNVNEVFQAVCKGDLVGQDALDDSDCAAVLLDNGASAQMLWSCDAFIIEPEVGPPADERFEQPEPVTAANRCTLDFGAENHSNWTGSDEAGQYCFHGWPNMDWSAWPDEEPTSVTGCWEGANEVEVVSEGVTWYVCVSEPYNEWCEYSGCQATVSCADPDADYCAGYNAWVHGSEHMFSGSATARGMKAVCDSLAQETSCTPNISIPGMPQDHQGPIDWMFHESWGMFPNNTWEDENGNTVSDVVTCSYSWVGPCDKWDGQGATIEAAAASGVAGEKKWAEIRAEQDGANWRRRLKEAHPTFAADWPAQSYQFRQHHRRLEGNQAAHPNEPNQVPKYNPDAGAPVKDLWCYDAVKNNIMRHQKVIAGVGLVVVAYQIFGAIFACIVQKAIKKSRVKKAAAQRIAVNGQ